MKTSLDRLHARIKQNKWLRRFTVMTRVLLAIAFLPSGLTKVVDNRFTILSPDHPIGYFFDALFQSGFYYNFIGVAQMTVAVLLLIPRTGTLGAVLYFPIILSLHFRGTWVITSLLLLVCVYLLCWDYDRLKGLWARRPESVISV